MNLSNFMKVLANEVRTTAIQEIESILDNLRMYTVYYPYTTPWIQRQTIPILH